MEKIKCLTICLVLISFIVNAQDKDSVAVITGRGEVRGSQKIMDLSYQNLEKIPIRALNPEIEVLILDNNNLTKLPVWLGDLKSLKILSLRNNSFITLDDVINNCENLEQLYLSGNRELSDISVINTAQKLELIDVIDTKINNEPHWIRMMDNLYYFKFTLKSGYQEME